MGRMDPEVAISRNIGNVAGTDQGLGKTAFELYKHFRSPDAYTPVGTDARDAQARDTGEFKRELKGPPQANLIEVSETANAA